VEHATRQLAAAGLDPQLAEDIGRLEFRIVDLSGDRLGSTFGDLVWIDLDGAGSGWSVDPVAVSPGEGRVDLLSVVMHELGHVIGLDHDELGETLDAGERLSPRVLSSPAQFDLPGSLVGNWDWSGVEANGFESNLGVPPVSVSLLISGMSGQGLAGESPYNTARVTGSYWTVPSTLVPFAFSIDQWRPTTLRLGLGPPLDQGDSSIFDEI
jgi:hypothetical protein